jgi:alkylated DNA repair dioxygenase AlkB
LFGDGKEKESGGSRILFDLLPLDMADTIFEELNHEVKWQKMYHQTGEVPRLVCCQGSIDEDGSMPVYRHPSDFTLPIESWTPAVDRVRKAAEQVIGHPLNHALIQLYRGGTDFISEHSDKTLDIVKDSFIVNISFGAQRKMRLRTKRSVAVAEASPGESTSSSRTTYRIPMPHNSIITMSLPTNAEYLHGINADKRPAVELTDAEKAFDAQRISLTFRNIGTFLDKDSNRIWGQGATGKAKDEAKAVINANAAESEKLVRAFGAENQSSHVDWDAIYGDGFDVLHLK